MKQELKLSLKDRVILANQCRIIEKLYPDEASAYARYRIALERGYVADYGRFPDIYEEEMPPEQSQEVLDILDMHKALLWAYNELEDKLGIEEGALYFHGFDGRDEQKYLPYARYVSLGYFTLRPEAPVGLFVKEPHRCGRAVA